MTTLSLGVEEEFHLVDVTTRRLRPRAGLVLGAAQRELADDSGSLDPELLQSQVETGTAVCTTLDEVRGELVRLRSGLAAAAAEADCHIIASGTYPGPVAHPPVTDDERYRAMAETFGLLAREQVACGCHVHVAVEDRELAIAVLRRSRPWLPALLAISANSPFWQGEDTGYASYRTQVWSRWPTAGPPAPFRSRAEYDGVVEAMLTTGVLRDRGMLYWLVRASAKYDTLEFRVADACLSVDEAVLLAGLVRALARTCALEEEQGLPLADTRDEVLRAATWQASRFGLEGELVDPTGGRPRPAADVVRGLVEHVRPALQESGDEEQVLALLGEVLAGGNGASRQRAAYRRRGDVADVHDLLVRGTAAAP